MKIQLSFYKKALGRLVVCCLLYPLGLRAQSVDTVRCWDVYEIYLQSDRQMENPYAQTISPRDSGAPYLTAVFRGVSGEAAGHRMVLTGFWDGNHVWKVRFAPPRPGVWEYRTVSGDEGLNGKKGTLFARKATPQELQSDPLYHGFIYVAKNGRNFRYADDTPFFWVGDTWWAWADKRIKFQSFKRLADDRSAKGFTVGQMYINQLKFKGASAHPDFDFIHQTEDFIRYANKKGIVVCVSGLWGGKVTSAAAAENRRWWKYLVSRLQAYNVVWMVASEYNMNNYGGAGLGYWKALGRLVKDQDPYKRITSFHNTPPNWRGGTQGDSRQWSTAAVLDQESWLDYNQTQLGHGKFRNEMAPVVVANAYAHRPVKPIVVTEPWYEFIPGSAPAMDIRFAFWSSFLSGAAGITYGGGHIWWAYLPDNHEKSLKDMGGFPLDSNLHANTLDYPGAQSVSFMAKFLSGKHWWEWRPHPELVLDYPARFCKADPGKEYLVYLRYGGDFRLDLRAAGNRPLHYRWIDLVTLKTKDGDVQGGGLRQFWNPRDYPGNRPYHDCLLYVTAAGPENAGR